MAAILLEHAKKSYGKHLGIRDVSFTVEEGEIFGFVGPNGAGKSTTIRILMNFIFASAGKASISGYDCATQAKTIRSFTGYVPSDVRLYGDMKLSELLRCNARFYEREQDDEIQRLCTLFGIDQTKKFRELSMGNKKKAALICALAAKPKVLILDEPTNGLDPMVQRELFQELKRQAANGMAILLSSHNLAEVQEYCNRVAFIRDGEIISITDLAAAARENRKVITIYGGGAVPDGFELLQAIGNKRVFRTNADGPLLLELLNLMKPESFTVEQEKMEERFLELYRKEPTL